MSDISLIFPPLTEARLFPYLSLPMISAYLKEKGLAVSQTDINIELCHGLFNKENFSKYKKNIPLNNSILKYKYRRALSEYLVEQSEYLSKKVFKKNSKSNILDSDILLIKNGIELLLEDSIFKKKFKSFDEIIQTVIFHQENENELSEKITKEIIYKIVTIDKPKIIGISIAYFSQIFPSILISKWIKELSPSTVIIIGGQQVMLRKSSFLCNERLKNFVDAIGTSQGEETLYCLMQFINGKLLKENIPNINWLNECPKDLQKNLKSQILLENLPPPDFDDLPINGYMNSECQLPLITCIGCYWGRCIFCSYGNRSKNENNYQQISPNKLSNNCLYLIEKYEIERINFVDENCNLSLIVRGLKKFHQTGKKIRFSLRNRMEKLLTKKSFCETLSSLGCVLMSCGYETNSQRILNLFDKGTESSDYQKIIDNLYESGITLRLSIIGGLPQENDDEFEESLSFIKKNSDKIGIDTMQMLICEPNTIISKNPEKFGLAIQSEDMYLGNDKLSYGMGRVGLLYKHLDGKKFSEAETKFLRFFYEVTPQKNSFQYKGENKNKNPFVKVLENNDKYMVIADLAYQKIWKKIIPFNQ